jgi:hypothetical protein
LAQIQPLQFGHPCHSLENVANPAFGPSMHDKSKAKALQVGVSLQDLLDRVQIERIEPWRFKE